MDEPQVNLLEVAGMGPFSTGTRVRCIVVAWALVLIRFDKHRVFKVMSFESFFDLHITAMKSAEVEAVNITAGPPSLKRNASFHVAFSKSKSSF